MRVLNSLFILVFALASVSIPANATLVCDANGVCTSDPSLTSDAPPSDTFSAAAAGDSTSTAAEVATGRSNYTSNFASLAAGSSTANAAQCTVSIAGLDDAGMAQLDSQMKLCEQIVKSHQAELDKKAQEDAKAKQDQKKDDQQQPPPPPGGGGGGDKGKGGDDKGGDDKGKGGDGKGGDDKGGGGKCENKVKEEIKVCEEEHEKVIGTDCDKKKNKGIGGAQEALQKGGAGGGNMTQTALSHGAGLGNAIDQVGEGQNQCNEAAPKCEQACQKASQKLKEQMNKPDCKEEKDKLKKKKEEMDKKGKECKAKQGEFNSGAEELKEDMGGQKDQAQDSGTKSGGGGAPDMSKLMEAMKQQQKKENEDPSQAKSNELFDVCTLPQAGMIPLICKCGRGNLSGGDCGTVTGVGTPPTGVGAGRDLESILQRLPSSGGDSTLPAGVSDEISPP